jgi:protease-4
VLDAWLDEVYADFTAKAAADRGRDLADLEPLARGRVWTGVDAHAHGLVDHLGGTDLALDRLCDLADLDREKVVLRAGPALPFLGQLRHAESSESGHTAAALPLTGLTGGPEAALAHLAGWVGLPLPHGVLSLPWRIEVS